MDRAQILTFCRTHGLTAAISTGVGVLVSSLYVIGRGTEDAVEILVIGGLVGLSIWGSIAVLQFLFRPALERLSERWRPVAFGVLFLVGGMTGWTIGFAVGLSLFGSPISIRVLVRPEFLYIMIASAAIAVLIGLSFRFVDALRERLTETIDRLKQHEWAEKELELARAIQKRLLPPEQIDGAGFSISARNLPARLVAGDFYDVVQLDDGSVVIAVADVAGKGIGASLIMASVKAVLPFVARNPVEEAMATLNDKLFNELDRREFVALTFARFFPAQGTLHLVNAGFPDPYLLREGAVIPLAVSGPRLPLGMRRPLRYESLVVGLEEGDRVLFVSDGIPEAPTPADEPLGYERLAEIVRTTNGSGLWLDEFLARVKAEVQPVLSDDWTAVVLENR